MFNENNYQKPLTEEFCKLPHVFALSKQRRNVMVLEENHKTRRLTTAPSDTG